MAKKDITPKADCVLSDGTEVYFDKHNIKPKEWRAMIAPDTEVEESNQILARFAGLEFAYVDDMNLHDWQMLLRAANDKVREPVTNPNSVSGSISPS